MDAGTHVNVGYDGLLIPLRSAATVSGSSFSNGTHTYTSVGRKWKCSWTRE